MPKPFMFDGTWVFPVSTGELWTVLSRTDRFQEWWPWLRKLTSPGLTAGTVSSCVVRGPAPYSLRFDVAVVEVVPERLVETRVSGDLEGPARLRVDPRPEGCRAHLSWELELTAPLLRAAARVARPVMEWSHNRVIDNGVRQFRRALLTG